MNQMEIVPEKNKVVVPKDAELIDDTFYVWRTRYGLYSTMTKQGRHMMTGGTKDGVTEITRWHLKCEQDGTLEQYTRVIGNSYVDGKL